MHSTVSLVLTLTSRGVQGVPEVRSRAAATTPIKQRLAGMLSPSQLQLRNRYNGANTLTLLLFDFQYLPETEQRPWIEDVTMQSRAD